MLLVRHLDYQVMYLLKRRKLEGNDQYQKVLLMKQESILLLTPS